MPPRYRIVVSKNGANGNGPYTIFSDSYAKNDMVNVENAQAGL
jgi:hypothetical protein